LKDGVNGHVQCIVRIWVLLVGRGPHLQPNNCKNNYLSNVLSQGIENKEGHLPGKFVKAAQMNCNTKNTVTLIQPMEEK
jgi:hypothetical protein